MRSFDAKQSKKVNGVTDVFEIDEGVVVVGQHTWAAVKGQRALTVEWDHGDFVEWDSPPPPPNEGPRVRFIPYDDPPVPLGGYGAIKRNIVYPEIAQEAGIEGTVVIQAFVDKKGKVTDTVVLKGIPNTGLDEAAMVAITKTKFKPAKQRDRAVGVWISIQVNFRLKG